MTTGIIVINHKGIKINRIFRKIKRLLMDSNPLLQTNASRAFLG